MVQYHNWRNEEGFGLTIMMNKSEKTIEETNGQLSPQFPYPPVLTLWVETPFLVYLASLAF
jgi:hypothetical protein